MKQAHICQSAFTVIEPGVFTLIQDLGRFGQANLGLTTGGPVDKLAFDWANRLLGNQPNDAMLEVTFGGLKLQANINTVISITGAELPFTINGIKAKLWSTHQVKAGDVLEIGFAIAGIRAYLAIAGGVQVKEQFSSRSTVVREGIGGIDGKALQSNDLLPAWQQAVLPSKQLSLLTKYVPTYTTTVSLRVVLGYQQAQFSQLQQRRFFNTEYKVSNQCDRMGYRLEGRAIKIEQTSMLSEGIALGAIQIPPDGQPIVLMHDRQTIGGYPKIGSVLSIDLAKLAQCGQGALVRFEPISIEQAHNELLLAKYRYDNTQPNATAW